MDLYSTGLTIGDLAQRAGVGISTLRAWERRYGFPTPARVPSGHRRYSERDVDAIAAVVRERDNGSTLEAAIRRAKAHADAPRSSVFASARDALGDTAPAVLSETAMLALSRAIEDEATTRADDAIFIGMFQTKALWTRSRRRWVHLTARAQVAVALAVGISPRQTGNLWEVSIDHDRPIAREWAVICDSDSFAACLVGVELPPRRNGGRRFEALWTVEPPVVRVATRTALALAAAQTPALGEGYASRVSKPAVATYDTLRAATSLTNRVIGHLDPGVGTTKPRSEH